MRLRCFTLLALTLAPLCSGASTLTVVGSHGRDDASWETRKVEASQAEAGQVVIVHGADISLGAPGRIELAVSPVPEPDTSALVVGGMAVLVWLRKRRN